MDLMDFGNLVFLMFFGAGKKGGPTNQQKSDLATRGAQTMIEENSIIQIGPLSPVSGYYN